MERFRANIVINGLEAWEEVSFEGGHIKPIWTFFFIESYGYFKLKEMPIDEVNVDIYHGCHRSGNDQGKNSSRSGKSQLRVFGRRQGEMKF